MSVVAELQVALEDINCCNCGFVFWVPVTMYNQWRRKHNSFFCPSCDCSQSYSGKSDIEKEREKVKKAEERTQRALADANEQRLLLEKQKNKTRAEKAAKTRLKNRIAAGVCPCCHRTFKQLVAHMKNKHPDFKVS